MFSCLSIFFLSCCNCWLLLLFFCYVCFLAIQNEQDLCIDITKNSINRSLEFVLSFLFNLSRHNLIVKSLYNSFSLSIINLFTKDCAICFIFESCIWSNWNVLKDAFLYEFLWWIWFTNKVWLSYKSFQILFILLKLLHEVQ